MEAIKTAKIELLTNTLFIALRLAVSIIVFTNSIKEFEAYNLVRYI